MADSTQRDESTGAGVGGPDHAVKIERLLLSGLDHYCRGRLEHAIDIWTRVLVLDRSHERARAYIDRARASVAEPARESEALLHAGDAACDRGDATEARALLTTAIARRARRGAVTATHTGHKFRVLPWVLLIALFTGASVVLYMAGSWAQLVPVRLADQTGRSPVPPRVPPAPLPVPAVPQIALERAKALAADNGHAEALGMLATVGLGDGLRGDVDALRAAIQQEMLSRLPEMAAGVAAESADRVNIR